MAIWRIGARQASTRADTKASAKTGAKTRHNATLRKTAKNFVILSYLLQNTYRIATHNLRARFSPDSLVAESASAFIAILQPAHLTTLSL
ncbi:MULTISPECIES: hypothetical protein [unclassified Helicobacter]|uniref:hypothetical protein n=1 Tax=unclassified Helicobacter TaxID=2593540 RepID=UPI00115FD3B0|nr:MULTISPECIES: hypothetical protein [unclassified Helicobacter]